MESPSDKNEDNPSRPSLSMYNKKRIQGEDFPGHCSQSRSSPSEKFGSPVTQKNKGTRIPQERRQMRVSITSNPMTTAENSSNIRKRNIQLTWKFRSSFPTTLEPSKIVGHRQSGKKNQERSRFLHILPIVEGVGWRTLLK